MNNAFKSILSIGAFSLAILFASCQKKDNTTVLPANDNQSIGTYQTMSLVSTCPSTCTDRHDTIQSDWQPASAVGSPTAFGTRYYNLETGEVLSTASYHFTLDGQFLSRLTAGGTLGFFNNTNVPPSSFSSMTCSDTAYWSTTNVVSNAMANNTATVQGWYIYNYMNPFLVSPSWIMGIYFPSCNKYYAVKLTVFVESQDDGLGGVEYRSNVVVETKCLGCGA